MKRVLGLHKYILKQEAVQSLITFDFRYRKLLYSSIMVESPFLGFSTLPIIQTIISFSSSFPIFRTLQEFRPISEISVLRCGNKVFKLDPSGVSKVRIATKGPNLNRKPHTVCEKNYPNQQDLLDTNLQWLNIQQLFHFLVSG